MLSKIAFVIPYFGPFPSVFPLWWDSCLKNSDVDFYLFTNNDEVTSERNIYVVHQSLQELCDRFESVLEFPINLQYPRKLCDFKPAYGELFEDILEGYDYWGYCDCDVILGDLRHFCDFNYSQKYDVFGGRGSLTLFRNNETINRLYRTPIEGQLRFQTVFQEESICVFDEWWRGQGLWTIFRNKKTRVSKLPVADIRIMNTRGGFYYPFLTYDEELDNDTRRNETSSIIYKSGKNTFIGTLLSDGRYIENEIAYVHFQKRPVEINNRSFDHYAILPNASLDIFDNSSPEVLLREWELSYKNSNEYMNCLYNYQNWLEPLNILRTSRFYQQMIETAEQMRSEGAKIEIVKNTKYPCCQIIKGNSVCERLIVFNDTDVELRKDQIHTADYLRENGLLTPIIGDFEVTNQGTTIEILQIINAVALSQLWKNTSDEQKAVIEKKIELFVTKLESLVQNSIQGKKLLDELLLIKRDTLSFCRNTNYLGWNQLFITDDGDILFYSWEKQRFRLGEDYGA